jgi:hypothetical protein
MEKFLSRKVILLRGTCTLILAAHSFERMNVKLPNFYIQIENILLCNERFIPVCTHTMYGVFYKSHTDFI